MRFRGPLADSYGAAVLLVLCALVPYLALTSAVTPLETAIGRHLGMSMQSLQLTDGFANAGYSFGTVVAIQLAVHLPARRLLVVYAALFTIFSVLAAAAPIPWVFITGRVGQGFFTSLMLIAAVPPLVTAWPAKKMPISAIILNLGIFGAVAVGPVVGGVQSAAPGNWRTLFWVVACIGAAAFLFAVLTFEDVGPQDRSAPWDWVALALAGGGSSAAFFGASELTTHPMLSLIVIIPLLAGTCLIVALVIDQFLVARPLMPLKAIASTLPVAGIVVAMTAGAASVAAIELAEQAIGQQGDPLHLAMLFWPEFGAAVFTAVVFGAVFKTRFIPVLVVFGMAALTGGAAELTGVVGGPHALIVVGSGLVGIGVGSSVAPALFLVGLSADSASFQRVVALVELLRSVAAFLVAPVLLHLAMTIATTPTGGISTALWVCFGLAAGGGLFLVYLFVLGRARLRPPDIEGWQEEGRPAFDSPPLAAVVRGEEPAPGSPAVWRAARSRRGPQPVRDGASREPA